MSTPSDILRQGLGLLLTDVELGRQFTNFQVNSAQFQRHPLGLTMPLPSGTFMHNFRLLLVSSPDTTSSSVSAMRKIAAYIAKEHPDKEAFSYLRRILGADGLGNYVYYEFGTFFGSFICGGGYDKGGEGGRGMNNLDALFAFLGYIFDLKIETVSVAAPRSHEFREVLREAWIKSEQDAA